MGIISNWHYMHMERSGKPTCGRVLHQSKFVGCYVLVLPYCPKGPRCALNLRTERVVHVPSAGYTVRITGWATNLFYVV